MSTSIAAKPLRLGEVVIVETDWLLTFKCDYCQKEISNFELFLEHSLQHFFDIKTSEFEQLYKVATFKNRKSVNQVEVLSPVIDEKEQFSIAKAEVQDMEEELELLYKEAIAEADSQGFVTSPKEEAEEFQSIDDDDVSVDEELFEATDGEDNDSNLPHWDGEYSLKNAAAGVEKLIKPMVVNGKKDFETVFLHIQKCDEMSKTNAKTDKIHTNEFLCPFCEKSFASNQNLTYHIRRHTTKYPCDRCDAVFNDVNNHRRHYARHLGKKPHACNICEKRFLTKTELRKHSATHSRERPFSCDECGSTFRSLAGYEMHQRKHTNTRPYECPQCDKAFFEKRQLEDHIKLHSCEFPYECAECGKQFKTRRPYQAHFRTEHSDQKIFECQNCSEVFQERIELYWHLRRNHWKKPHKNATLNINQTY